MEVKKVTITRWDIPSQAHAGPDFGVRRACRTCFAEDTVDGSSVCMARCAGPIFDALSAQRSTRQQQQFVSEKIANGGLPIVKNPGLGATHKVDCSLYLIGAEVTIGK
jgi:hypothetical protein